MKKIRTNKKGFTLAELLIVVAIIGVLVAISIPIFTAQLKKARLATNQANARSAHAALVAELLGQDDATNAGSDTYTVSSGSLSGTVAAASAGKVTSDPSTWTTDTETGTDSTKMGDKVAKSWTVSIDTNGAVSYTPDFSTK
ncbi:MAG: prepilin-type N-terminal cleavage/methylation domain-containing protein [Anaerolactibacter massiliensis]|nr:prepilin-type N-terminal cleavage/methylation domain-containing protein [Anaerolactibacter massiliensis]